MSYHEKIVIGEHYKNFKVLSVINPNRYLTLCICYILVYRVRNFFRTKLNISTTKKYQRKNGLDFLLPIQFPFGVAYQLCLDGAMMMIFCFCSLYWASCFLSCSVFKLVFVCIVTLFWFSMNLFPLRRKQEGKKGWVPN